MKNKILPILALVPFAFAINATDLSDARIYLNPGHGSWGSNDRPMATIPYPNLAETQRPDTCGFYESNTNLWKVLKLGTTLEKMGAKKENIMYSRVKNGPFPYVKGAEDESLYNRNLSEICEEVEANNIDYFLSVHSNAATEGTATNYPLFIYRGKDNGDDYADGSYEKSDVAWNYLTGNKIDPFTAYLTSKNLRGDVSFYGSESGRTDPKSGITYNGYLGVLKHGASGFLSEGYFHTYQPARHRALNKDYCGQEGVRYARGIAAYYNAEGEKTGYIMGTVKDLHEKLVNSLYKYSAGSIDQWLPLNGAKVILYKDKVKVDEYLVDNNYNGVFVFEGLNPGQYTLDVEVEGYKALGEEYKEALVVKANETTYSQLYLESESYVPPTPDEIVYEDYPDPIQDSFTILGDSYNIKSVVKNALIAELDGKAIKRTILKGDSLYVLAHDGDKKPFIYVIEASTQALKHTVNTEGTQGGIYAISDIAVTADKVLIATNSEETTFTPSKSLRIYKWNKLDEAPIEWFASTKSGNWVNSYTGKTMAYSGTSKKGTLIVNATTTGSSKKSRFVIFSIEESNNATDWFNKDDATFTEVALGDKFELNVSPLGQDRFVLDAELTNPIEFEINTTNAGIITSKGKISNNLLEASATGASYFKYAKKAMMIAPSLNGEIKLLDISKGFAKAESIELIDKSITNPTADNKLKSISVSGVTDHIYAAVKVDNSDMSIYVNGGGISLFTTKSVTQEKVKAIYAYDLKSSKAENGYNIEFKANYPATSAYIVLYDEKSKEEKFRKEISNVIEGLNSISLDTKELPVNSNNYSWGIELTSKAVPTISLLNDLSAPYQFVRATGVAVDNSPESDYFGRIYVDSYKTGSAGDRTINKVGIYAYNSDWSEINSEAYTGGTATLKTPYRIGIDSKGKVYIPDWSDGNSGIFIMDPANMEGDFVNLFRNGTRNADGLFSVNGVATGGSTPGVNILGTGSDTKLYCYSEDYKGTSGNGNGIAIYNIGEADSWDVAPSNHYDIGATQLNTNGNIIATEDGGVWVAQTRSNGQNSAGVPSLVYVNNKGEIVFHSGKVLSETLLGSMGSGFAISPDGKTLIINNAANKFQLFDITWNEGVPTLTDKGAFAHNIGEGSGGNIYQMQFDYAGNLVTIGQYLAIFSFPKENNTSITPAKSTDLLVSEKFQALPVKNLSAVVDESNNIEVKWDAPDSQLGIDAPTYSLKVDDEDYKSGLTETSTTISNLDLGNHTISVVANYSNGQSSEPISTTIQLSGTDLIETPIISIYPNPATSTININSNTNIEKVEIYNGSGMLMISSRESSIDIEALSSGIYFVKINDQKPIRLIKK